MLNENHPSFWTQECSCGHLRACHHREVGPCKACKNNWMGDKIRCAFFKRRSKSEIKGRKQNNKFHGKIYH